MATKRDYKKENEYKSQPDQIAKRVARNKARRMMLKAGKVHKGDGLAVDHIVPLSKGGKNVPSNMRVVDANLNDSYDRNSDHSLKKNVPSKKIKAKEAKEGKRNKT
jgi:hypothetical protein